LSKQQKKRKKGAEPGREVNPTNTEGGPGGCEKKVISHIETRRKWNSGETRSEGRHLWEGKAKNAGSCKTTGGRRAGLGGAWDRATTKNKKDIDQ